MGPSEYTPANPQYSPTNGNEDTGLDYTVKQDAPDFTERELEVITALARGAGNKQIARSLDISEKTVRNHISNIYRELHIYDRTQAVLYAIREGLVDVEGWKAVEPRSERGAAKSYWYSSRQLHVLTP